MQPCPPPDPHPHPPRRLTVPPGACDCHAHVFGPAAEFPYSAGRDYTPPDATRDNYIALLDTLGLARGVIVQPSVYAADNRATLAALEAYPKRLRGVAVVPGDIPDAEMLRMHKLGVRGVRFNVLSSGATPLDRLEVLCARIAPLGWHVQVHMSGAMIMEHRPRLERIPIPLVIDHFGGLKPEAGPDQPAFQALLALVQGGAWVKLSGQYRTTPGAPFTQHAPYAKLLWQAAPERCLWGTDWPHPQLYDRPMPNDGDLLDALADWGCPPAVQKQILVDNPARLYQFD